MCRIAPTVYLEDSRIRIIVRRLWSRTKDIAFLSVEIAYYPLLVFGIAMILWSG